YTCRLQQRRWKMPPSSPRARSRKGTACGSATLIPGSQSEYAQHFTGRPVLRTRFQPQPAPTRHGVLTSPPQSVEGEGQAPVSGSSIFNIFC
ncbi:unnamed protein product, partial [Tetraodon nigroviridis]